MASISNEGNGYLSGQGIIQVPMFKNARLGVEFSRIRVAEGGCVTEGEIKLSGVDLALLDEKTRAGVAKIYEVYNQVLDVADKLADEIADGLNKANKALAESFKNKKKEAKAALDTYNQANFQAAVAGMQADLAAQVANMKAASTKASKEQLDKLKPQIAKLEADKKAIDDAVAKADPKTAPEADVKAAFKDVVGGGTTGSSADALAVEYNGKTYGNGKTIDIINGKNKIVLANLLDGEAIVWKVMDGETEIATGSIKDISIAFPAGKNLLSVEGIQGKRKINLKVKKLPSVVLNGLELKDYDTPSRVATAGQKLYLIPTKGFSDIPFGAGTSFNRVISTISTQPNNPSASNFDAGEPKWTITYDGKTDPNWPNMDGKSTFQIPLNGSSTKNYVYTAEVNGVKKSANVEMVEYKNSKTDYTQKIKGFWDILMNVQEIAKKIEPVFPCTFSVAKLDNMIESQAFNMSYTILNEEDKKTRHIINKERYDFKLLSKDLAKFECSKNLGVKFWIVDLTIGEVYFNIGVSSDLSLRRDEGKIYETNEKIEPVTSLTGTVKLGTEIGGRIGNVWTLNAGSAAEIKVGVKVTVAANAAGGIRMNYPYKNNFEELAGYFYMDPIKIKVSGEASAGIYSKALSWDYPLTGDIKSGYYVINFKSGYRYDK